MNDSATPDRHLEFVRLLNAGHRRLLAYLVSILGNRHDAEDVLQRASVTLWKKFDTFTIEPAASAEEQLAQFQAWASTVAFYEAKNFQRAAIRSRLYFSDSLMEILAQERAIDLAQVDVRHAALETCLASLDPAAMQLVEAAYLEEGSLTALAEKLGRAPQTLYNKLNGIRKLLAQCVERRLAES